MEKPIIRNELAKLNTERKPRVIEAEYAVTLQYNATKKIQSVVMTAKELRQHLVLFDAVIASLTELK